jgi:hypothetical protein
MPADWYAESLRLTIFVPNDRRPEPLFAAISGVSPEAAMERSPLQFRQETGSVAGASLSVIQQVGRVDVMLTGMPPNPAIPSESPFSWIGRFPDELGSFDSLTNRAVGVISNALRIAYSPVLLRPMGSVEEVNAALKLMLPTIRFDPGNDTDIIWQINRRRRSASSGLINRLAKWESLQVQVGHFQLNQGPMPVAMPLLTDATGFAVKLSLDVNTDPNNVTPIEGEAVEATLVELRSYAIEIADGGDLP